MPDLKVVPLNNLTKDGLPKSGENVIARLEQALKWAKEGGVENCAVVLLSSNEDVIDGWANGNYPYQMIGAIESLKVDFMNSAVEQR